MRTLQGVCKLTGDEGRFVKSHILPRALTNIGEGSEKATEHELGLQRPIRRPPGWYDKELVTTEGERILERADNNGIKELRKIGLIWSSHRHKELRYEVYSEEAGTGLGTVRSEKPKRLRMFVLSLLWRAAATDNVSFQAFNLPSEMEQRLKQLLNADDPGQPEEFPTCFIPLVGSQFPHNQTPVREDKGAGTLSRFFLDGMVMWIGDSAEANPKLMRFPKLLVGFQKEFTFITMNTGKSRQIRDITDVAMDAGLI